MRAHDGLSSGKLLPCLKDRGMVSSFVLGKVEFLFGSKSVKSLAALMPDVITVFHRQWGATRGILAEKL